MKKLVLLTSAVLGFWAGHKFVNHVEGTEAAKEALIMISKSTAFGTITGLISLGMTALISSDVPSVPFDPWQYYSLFS